VVTREPAPVIILEGAYSTSSALSDIVDLTVLVEAPAEERTARHNRREKTDDAEWHDLWDEAEAITLGTRDRMRLRPNQIVSKNPTRVLHSDRKASRDEK
jgi:hypothetical protein